MSKALDKTASVLIAQETLRLLHLPQDPDVGALPFLARRRQQNDSVCSSVGPFIHPSVWLAGHPSICLSICQSIHPSSIKYPSVLLTILLSIYPSSIHPSSLSIHWSGPSTIHPSIHRSVHPSIHLSTQKKKGEEVIRELSMTNILLTPEPLSSTCRRTAGLRSATSWCPLRASGCSSTDRRRCFPRGSCKDTGIPFLKTFLEAMQLPKAVK